LPAAAVPGAAPAAAAVADLPPAVAAAIDAEPLAADAMHEVPFQQAEHPQQPADQQPPAGQQRRFQAARPSPWVPREAHKQWANATTNAIHAVLQAHEQGDHQVLDQRTHALLALPGKVLAVNSNGGGRRQSRRTTRVRARLRELEEGEIAEPEPPAEQCRKRQSAHTQAAGVHHMLKAGIISRAAGRLQSAELAELTPETIAQLQRLHPHEEPPEVPEFTAQPVDITEELLRTVLRRMPKGSAPGPSGWTYEHIRAAALASEDAFEAVRRLVNLILSGELPYLAELLDSTLIAFKKPGGGIRPIAIGEVFYRLAALSGMAAVPDVGRSLAPLQLAVGTRGGAQTMGHAVGAAMDADQNDVVVQIDFENAHNTLLRSELLKAIAKRCTALLPFFAWAYRQHSRLWISDAPDNVGPIMSQRGVKQGDPGSTFAFCVTLQDHLEQALAANPDAPQVAFSDDVTVIAGADACLRGVPALIDACEPLGLGVKKPKCGVTSANAEASACVAQGLAMPDRPAGPARGRHGTRHSTVHRRPRATQSRHRVRARRQAHGAAAAGAGPDAAATHVAAEEALAPAAHHAVELHSGCGAPARGQSAQRSATHRQAARRGAAARAQRTACAALRHGGLGLQDTSVMSATAAFVSGAATAHVTLRGTQLQPFNADMVAAWQLVYDAAAQMDDGAPWPEDTRGADAAAIEQVIQFVQRDFARHESAATHATLLASPTAQPKRARSRACAAAPRVRPQPPSTRCQPAPRWSCPTRTPPACCASGWAS
jgi:Reverse transcriptase (RNA-dependent DNA polymerase)